jgi:integrase
MCSALRTVGRAIGRRLDEIPANPRWLRERFATLSPAMAGVSIGRWQNVQSLLRSALKHAGLTAVPGRSTEPLSAEWQELFRHSNDRRVREGISRFARYCSSRGITPSDVDEAVSSSFLAGIEDKAIIREPRKVHRTLCVCWNRMAQISPWPLAPLAVPQYRQTYSLPWQDFPPALHAKAVKYFARLSGADLLDGNDLRPLRPASIKTYDRLLRAFLSALVQRGHDPAGLRCLSDVIAVGVVKDGLRFFIDRAGGVETRQVYQIARMLTALARHEVGVDANHLEQLRAICRRLDTGKGGLTQKNRDRLRQFDDPGNIGSLILLPQRVFAELGRCKEPSVAEALRAQSALGVELLLMASLRIGNLAALDLDRNIIRNGRRGREVVHLAIPAEDVKNSVAIEAELTPETVGLLDLYLERYRPLLLDGSSPWLFPGQGAKAKSRHTLGLQVKKFIKRKCGLEVNVHLFRHIGAKLYLDAYPGAYGLIQRVHGHRSSETTTRYYCGTENVAAMRHFDKHILRLREQASAKFKLRSARRKPR